MLTHPLADIRRVNALRERRAVIASLERCGWVLVHTAADLEIRPTELQRLLDRHDLRALYTERNPGKGRHNAPR